MKRYTFGRVSLFHNFKCFVSIFEKTSYISELAYSRSLFSVAVSVVFSSYLQRFVFVIFSLCDPFSKPCTCFVKGMFSFHLVKMFLYLHVFWPICVSICAWFLKVQRVSPNGSIFGR